MTLVPSNNKIINDNKLHKACYTENFNMASKQQKNI